MPSHDTCRREIESLHEFFVDWYTGQRAAERNDRLERALAADFEMVQPDGDRRPYADVVAGIREQYASREPGTFDIQIRNVETRERVDNHALVRYEEWQETPTDTTGRLSTALFEGDSDAPGGVVWLDLHETWLEKPDGQGE
jgi:hypothetical protein